MDFNWVGLHQCSCEGSIPDCRSLTSLPLRFLAFISPCSPWCRQLVYFSFHQCFLSCSFSVHTEFAPAEGIQAFSGQWTLKCALCNTLRNTAAFSQCFWQHRGISSPFLWSLPAIGKAPGLQSNAQTHYLVDGTRESSPEAVEHVVTLQCLQRPRYCTKLLLIYWETCRFRQRRTATWIFSVVMSSLVDLTLGETPWHSTSNLFYRLLFEVLTGLSVRADAQTCIEI